MRPVIRAPALREPFRSMRHVYMDIKGPWKHTHYHIMCIYVNKERLWGLLWLRWAAWSPPSLTLVVSAFRGLTGQRRGDGREGRASRAIKARQWRLSYGGDAQHAGSVRSRPSMSALECFRGSHFDLNQCLQFIYHPHENGYGVLYI